MSALSATSPARSLACIAILAAVLVGCGNDDEAGGGGGGYGGAPGGTTATATAPAQPPVTTVTVPATPAPATVTAPAPAPNAPEEAPGGAGDEEGIHVPARFVLQPGGTLEPTSAEVPEFLGVAVTVENRDGAAHRLEAAGQSVDLPAGRTTVLQLEGRAATDVPLLIDGQAAGTLHVVNEW